MRRQSMKIHIRENGTVCSGPEASITDHWIVVWVNSNPRGAAIHTTQYERHETLAAEVTDKEETLWIRIDKIGYSEIDLRKLGGIDEAAHQDREQA
jgi:hypothetical protein